MTDRKDPPPEPQNPAQPPVGPPPPFDPQLDLIGDAERGQGPPQTTR